MENKGNQFFPRTMAKFEVITYETQWQDDNRITIMAMYGDKPVGTCMVDFSNDKEHKGQALLWNLQVSKGHRQEGIGQILLGKAVQCAKLSGCKELHLVWRKCDSPEWVMRWYERNGFDECAFGRGIVEMKKILNNETETD